MRNLLAIRYCGTLKLSGQKIIWVYYGSNKSFTYHYEVLQSRRNEFIVHKPLSLTCLFSCALFHCQSRLSIHAQALDITFRNYQAPTTPQTYPATVWRASHWQTVLTESDDCLARDLVMYYWFSQFQINTTSSSFEFRWTYSSNVSFSKLHTSVTQFRNTSWLLQVK